MKKTILILAAIIITAFAASSLFAEETRDDNKLCFEKDGSGNIILAQGGSCPSGYPVNCGNGKCCTNERPLCCGNGRCCPSGRPYNCPSQSECYATDEEVQLKCDGYFYKCW